MKILVLNCGSSSVKFQLINMTDEKAVARGLVEKIGSSDAIITYKPVAKNKLREIQEIPHHDTALEIVLSLLLHPQHGVIKHKEEIDGIGHRVVHGGEDFSDSVLITEKVKATIQHCIQFAPLHNPHNLSGIKACERLLPGIQQVGVFDTAFHQTIPKKAFLYGLPYSLYKKLGIRRYGFHGTSHKFVAQKAAEILKKPIEKVKLITCHLGNGASITAVDKGISVDTTMGFTPLEGLVMGTRCGDIDPALVPYIMDREGLSTKEIDNIMNKNSGMLGLTETTNDMREIEDEAFRGNEKHKMALGVYCHRLKKYIGAYITVLGGVDAIVFTGGVGEKSFYVREHTLTNLENLGIKIDLDLNNNNKTNIGLGKVKILIIPTNEELAIARDTKKILKASHKTQKIDVSTAKEPEVITDLTEEEKAQLVLLWAEDPNAPFSEITRKLNKKIGKNIDEQSVKDKLKILGLSNPSKTNKIKG
ncbi:MAG: acetate kinase [bacterium]